MRVIGIDPSLSSTGFGIVESRASTLSPIAFGIIKPTASLPVPQKLLEIRGEIEKIIESYVPGEAAIENPFFARNVKTALLLGQVRGAVLVALAARRCRIHEYSPLEIKKAVTGYGQAGKDQVQAMVRILLSLGDDKIPEDASDALAAAVCHLNTRMFELKIGGLENP